jgi:hypothetical protein
MRYPVLLWRCGVVALLLGMLLVRGVPAGVLPPDGKDKLDRQYTGPVKELFKRLSRGDQPYTGRPEEKDAIDIIAKWNSYRFTWSEIQDATKDPPKAGVRRTTIDDVWRDYEGDLSNLEKNKSDTRQQFTDAFAHQMIVRLKEVLQDDKPIARINAARVLARLGRTGAEEVADACVELIKDPKQNDAVRYWAFSGLRELFSLGHGPQPILMKNQAREANAILTLLEWLEQKPTSLSAASTPEEVEGYRILRREAIRALALTRYPAVTDEKRALKGRTALMLVRIGRKDGFVPEPRIDEQVEAAFGLARMQSKLYDGYQPDYAAHQIAAIVVDFAERYLDLRGERGWKYHAARLNEALAAMKLDVERNPAIRDKAIKDYVGQEVVARCAEVLRTIETRGSPTINVLRAWVESTPPKNDTIYRGVADAKLKPAEPMEP